MAKGKMQLPQLLVSLGSDDLSNTGRVVCASRCENVERLTSTFGREQVQCGVGVETFFALLIVCLHAVSAGRGVRPPFVCPDNPVERHVLRIPWTFLVNCRLLDC